MGAGKSGLGGAEALAGAGWKSRGPKKKDYIITSCNDEIS